MRLLTLDMTLTQKTSDPSPILVNRPALDILSLLFEFKVASSAHIARFLGKEDQDKHIYRKLRRMWNAHLLESVKVFAGSRAGMPVYYLLSQKGLKTLLESGMYGEDMIRSYPEAKTLLSSEVFKHEAHVVEIASMEARNSSADLAISMKGELASVSSDVRSSKTVEVFTPDYTVRYSLEGRQFTIYTEYERTLKSKEAMLKKIERYVRHLPFEERKASTVRIIFFTPSIEQSFWLALLGGSSRYLERLRIMTTNTDLINDRADFFKPIFASAATARLTGDGRQEADISNRIKLFPFL